MPEQVSLPADTHLHTPLCRHAEGLPEAYVAAAAARGIPEITFTDHAPAPCGYDARHRMTLEEFPQYRDMIAPLQAGSGPAVRFGIEADYYPGCETFLPGWLERQDFDLVLGSVHYIDNWPFDSPEGLATWNTTDVTSAWRAYFALIARLADTGWYDVLSHPDLPKKFGHRIDDAQFAELVQPALDRVAAAGMAFEINTSGLRKEAAEVYPNPVFLRLAHERGIPLCFGSDAHAPHEVGAGFETALTAARDAGYTHAVRFERRRQRVVPL